MNDGPRPPVPPGSDAPLEGRLDSWKEIAAYLGRGIRTVQRWEREEHLPVHRLAHDKRGSVYARRDELAAWWESRRRSLSVQTESDAAAAPPAPRLERVTRTSAMTNWPALSSDARMVAYVSDAGQDGTTPQIWLQQIGGAALRLTDRERDYSHLSFSADDTRVFFTASGESGPSVFQVPTLGGDARLVHAEASGAQMSHDGRWLACVPRDSAGLRLSAGDGAAGRTIASRLVDVSCAAWSPDSRSLLVHARPDPAREPDWWIVPIDGAPPANTGLVQRFREAGLFTLPTGLAWVGDSLVFSAAGPQGVNLYRQRIAPSTLQPVGGLQRLTASSESAWLPAAAAGHVAFVSSNGDSNLWSIAVDASTGRADGPLRRMSRGPSPCGYLSVTTDCRTLAYFSFRLGAGDIFLRDLGTGSETRVEAGPAGSRSYPALSPSGRLLAYSMRMLGGEPALRPIFIVSLPDGSCRKVCDDCGGRPREWIDEHRLIIERFARLNSVAAFDTDTGRQHDLLESAEHSIRNPRLSPDRRWVAFDASRSGEPTAVYVAPFREHSIPPAEWLVAERSASHPFWSADGRLLYYTAIGTNQMIRSAIRARHFAPDRFVDRPAIAVFASNEMMMPAYLPGTAPIATRDQIIMVLGDFRGDIWLMELDPASE